MKLLSVITLGLAVGACSGPSENLQAVPDAMLTPPPRIVAQSAVATGLCRRLNYHYQARKLADGTLCTNFQWSGFTSPSFAWNASYNTDARKTYCYDSAQDPCFISS